MAQPPQLRDTHCPTGRFSAFKQSFPPRRCEVSTVRPTTSPLKTRTAGECEQPGQPIDMVAPMSVTPFSWHGNVCEQLSDTTGTAFSSGSLPASVASQYFLTRTVVT
jgi:hypothetical protein